jgi:hypothetical protein
MPRAHGPLSERVPDGPKPLRRKRVVVLGQPMVVNVRDVIPCELDGSFEGDRLAWDPLSVLARVEVNFLAHVFWIDRPQARSSGSRP